MPLSAGARFGPYEVTVQIGAGGMGEVYRAKDTRLDRIVAIKVLSAHVAADPQFRERFDREARAIATLNHPHICTLYDIGEAPDPSAQLPTRFLVMEYLEGETLADRLMHGALPLDQVFRVAIEIADALDKAHRAGITHRDLKPGNVMLTKAGAKLLDFGLAKTNAPSVAGTALSMVPTAADLTAQGTILGTLHYMSPEQVEGRHTDGRTDLFSFGAIVYEMVTGKRAFDGKSSASVIAAILEREPPAISSLQPLTPRALNHLVTRCLAKDPDDRWQTARDVHEQLRWISQGGSQPGVTGSAATAPQVQRRRTSLMVAATVLGAVVSGGAVWNLTRGAPSSAPVVSRWLVATPTPLSDLSPMIVAISPDGTRIAYLAEQKSGGGWAVYIRDLDRLESRMITGSEISREAPGFGHLPFFSPDGAWIGFRSRGQGIMRAALGGGPPVKILDDPRAWFGAEWESDDTLIFATGSEGLFRVSVSAGRSPERLMKKPDPGVAHILPALLPGGRTVLFTQFENDQAYSVALLDLETREHRILIESAGWAAYTATGHLVFARGDTLMAAPFDLARLAVKGEPVAVLEGVRFQDYAVSRNGTLVYVPSASAVERARLAWVNRKGQAVEPVVNEGIDNPRDPRLSPDGRRLALVTGPATGGQLWVHDLSGRPLLPLFEERSRSPNSPVWSPDGTRVAFSFGRASPTPIYWLPADGSARDPRPIGTSAIMAFPGAWLKSGELLFWAFVGNQFDIRTASIDTTSEPRDLVATNDVETAPAVSPNGRWLAYVSNRTGRNEIWVRSYTGGTPVRVSQGGGLEPVWSRDSRELFYLQGNIMMSVAVKIGDAEFAFTAAAELFKAPFVRPTGFGNTSRSYDVASDGRFLMIQPVGDPPGTATPTSIVVVENWFEELKRRVPTN